jgi:hypothetical protein
MMTRERRKESVTTTNGIKKKSQQVSSSTKYLSYNPIKMKVFAPLALLLLAFQEQTLATTAFNGGSIASLFKPPASKTDRNEKVLDLLSQAKQVGQVGSMATEEERSSMKNLAGRETFRRRGPTPTHQFL